MNRFVSISALTLGLLLAACSNHSDTVIERPGGQPVSETALLDGAMRIESSQLTLRYDDGGILFNKDINGTISAIRLADDARFTFNPDAPTLSINGVSIAVARSEEAKRQDATTWYRITTDNASDAKVYIVVSL